MPKQPPRPPTPITSVAIGGNLMSPKVLHPNQTRSRIAWVGADTALRTIAKDGGRLSRRVGALLRTLETEASKWTDRVLSNPFEETTEAEVMAWIRDTGKTLRSDLYGLPPHEGKDPFETIAGNLTCLASDYLFNSGTCDDIVWPITDLAELYENAHPLQEIRAWREPPRYAQLPPRVRSNLFSKHLSDVVAEGRDIFRNYLSALADEYAKASSLPWDIGSAWSVLESKIEHWILECISLLRSVQVIPDSPDDGKNPLDDFLQLIHAWKVGGNQLLTEYGFTGACLELGTIYLERLERNMQDFTDPSVQSSNAPHYSQIFNAPVYGQAAMKIDNINSNIAGVLQQGDPELGRALGELKEAILADTANDEELRRDLFDNLETLTEQAQTSPEERKRGVIRSILSSFKSAAMSGPEVAKAMEAWGQILTGLTQ
ncbi:hypothetical protein [Nocardia sp. NPDC052112]|uniref:hypothetical protein n=1 Tax=Nocardia sp. NPDC052112 TaxID=3155646 RepID=UPI003439CB15